VSTSARESWWPRLIAIMLCAIAITAMLIVGLTRGRQSGPRTQPPVAPGLAALTDQQLAELLPAPSDFPASWAVKSKTNSDRFGYSRQQPFHEPLGDDPAECSNVGELGAGSIPAAEVSGRNPADPPDFLPDPQDIRVTLAREFDRGGFTAMIDLVSRCSRFNSGGLLIYTVRVLEDSRPANGPQRFRIVKTTAASNGDPSVAGTEYYSYARTSRLILIGYARDGNEGLLDTVFDNTLRRMASR
jgi:hypothetical protein